MAFSLRHIPQWKALELKGNGKNHPNTYGRYMRFLDSIPEKHWVDDYTVLIPESYFDSFMKDFQEITTMSQTVSSIKGNEKLILPDISVEPKHLSSLKMEPYPFQKLGISYLLSVKRGILGDEMGLGDYKKLPFPKEI